MTRTFPRFLLFLLALLAVSPASAQFGFAGGEPHVEVRAVASHTSVEPGGELIVAVVFDHAEGWHAHTNDPHAPESWGFDPIPTTIDAKDLKGLELVGTQWPEPHTVDIDLSGSGNPEPYEVFEGEAVAYLVFKVADDAEEVGATVEVGYQACNDSVCDAPVFPGDDGTVFEISAEVGETTPNEGERALFSGYSTEGATVAPEPPSDANHRDVSPVGEVATPPSRTFFGIPVPQGNVLVIGLLAALGGLILNLTPCVLPVIPIKIMTISKLAQTPGKSFVLGLWMALGVIAFWVVLGLPVAFLTSVTDPSRVFGIWWVTLGIGLLIAAMGVGIMGLFEIQLPRSVYAINPKADTAWGSFVFGVMTAVLGLPCFGFVVGPLLATSAMLSTSEILAVFGGIGFGMALPYFILSAFPKLLSRVPKSGPASSLVKQVMGLLLLAAAAFFVGSGLIALVSEQPWLARLLHWWTVAAFATLAGLWLTIRTLQIAKTPAPKIVFSIVSLVIAGVAIWYAADATAKAKTHWLLEQETLAVDDGRIITTTWMPYTEARRQKALDEGYVVAMNFTAEWCLICKGLKARVLDPEPVKSLLASDDIVMLTVDLTSRKAPGWDKLHELGETGIPLLVVEGPDGFLWKSNAYTAAHVEEAVEQARHSTRVGAR